MKNSFKNDSFSLDTDKAFTGRILEKIYKKWFLLARQCVFTTPNEAFVKKIEES